MKYIFFLIIAISSCTTENHECGYNYCGIINENPWWKEGIVVNGKLVQGCELCKALKGFGAVPLHPYDLNKTNQFYVELNESEANNAYGCPKGIYSNCKYCK